MKSFKQYLKEASVLMGLIDKHDDPYSFLAAAMDAMSNGTLKLKTRGLANARELVAVWNKIKKNKIKVLPTIIIFKDGEEIYRFEADLSFKMVATREELQEYINELIEDVY